MNRAISLAATGFLVGLTLVACGKDDNKDSMVKGDGTTEDIGNVTKISGKEADIKVLDNSFNDENIQVKPGTKVVWKNDGQQDHDIIAVKDSAGFGVDQSDFNAGDVYEHTFAKPGTYHYYCSLHGSADAGMTGTIIVK